MHDIKGFFGPYRWLSNFADCKIVLNDLEFPSTENAYQAAKFLAAGDFAVPHLLTKCSAKEAKAMGAKAPLVSDWNEFKIVIMTEVIDQKFNQSPYKELLLSTGNCYIEETNTWNDTFWGVCNGRGENNLGKLIMKKRENLHG